MVKKTLQDLKKDKFLMVLLGASIIFFFLYLLSLGLTNTVFADKAVLGLKISNVSVGGKNKTEIEALLKQEIEEYKKGKVEFTVGKNKYEENISALNPEYNLEEVAAKAVTLGKRTLDLRELAGRELKLTATIKEEESQRFYNRISEKENTPFNDAFIELKNNKLEFVEEKAGSGVTEQIFNKELLDVFSNLKNTATLTSGDIKPKVTIKDLEPKKAEIEEFLNKPLTIKADLVTEKLLRKDLANWLSFEKDGNEVKLTVKEKTARDFVNKISAKVNITPKDALLTEKNGKVEILTPAVDGKTVNIEKSILELIKKAVHSETVILPLKVTKAKISEGTLSSLGLKELVSTGTSSFAGSPTNRRHNIKTGASKFNGILIKPEEVFSFNKYLGEVDAANGYLPELVILQNKTEPQYGGGLCQVSSTAFRAALNAGMPIVARLNHAYPVSYYYPIGVDATIYLPNPDLKFQNDTEGNIYVQTIMTGNTLKFEFYGTKLKRSVKFSGNENGDGSVDKVENVKPYLFNHNAKGRGSVDSIFYRFTYDEKGKLIDTYKAVSKYDSPDKYPHPVGQ